MKIFDKMKLIDKITVGHIKNILTKIGMVIHKFSSQEPNGQLKSILDNIYLIGSSLFKP